MRSEQEIFDELATFCTSGGYVHALAALCFRDTIVGFAGEIRPEDMTRLFSWSRLIRTELTTLMGLMLRAPINFTLPPQETISKYGARSEQLLEELHKAMLRTAHGNLDLEKLADPKLNFLTNGDALREVIFYGGESAYTFQYRDLAPLKYAADAQWLEDKRGLNLQAAREVVKSLTDLLNGRVIATLRDLRERPTDEWTMLSGFTFSCAEIADLTGLSLETVTGIVEAFCAPSENANPGFTSLHAFNAAYAYPILRKGPDEFILLQCYGITEALYETPFYWMIKDNDYKAVALKHRGDFTEDFAHERLLRVFGSGRVFKNVEILRSASATLGEIDVLVVFGDRAIVIQAKSKKLTLEARKGNDLQLQGDFKAAVQDAVDQAFLCAEGLNDPAVILRCRDGKVINLPKRPKTIFPLAVVADHYPALAFQARHLLKFCATDQIVAPLVIDVFALDAITEMLASPLRFLSYLNLRARFGENFLMSHEHTLLSYHLKHNLWCEEDVSLMMVDDDVSADLDIAMAARRDDVPGAKTPEGILTRFADTPFERMFAQIEDEAEPVAISLGFLLLELGEDAIRQLNKAITQVLHLTARDGALHNVTMGFSEASAGLTIHCSNLPRQEAEERLYAHCKIRKYSEKANAWCGVALRPDGSLLLAAELTGKWQFDVKMELMLKQMPVAKNVLVQPKNKIGRNDLCPCGSGKKYKKCCLSSYPNRRTGRGSAGK
jgi:hypothetical protein